MTRLVQTCGPSLGQIDMVVAMLAPLPPARGSCHCLPMGRKLKGTGISNSGRQSQR